MYPLKPIFASVIFLGLMASCASKTIYIDQNDCGKDKALPYNGKDCVDGSQCIYKIRSVEDDRRNRDNLGRISRDLISDRGVTEWLKNGFLQIKDCGLSVHSTEGDSGSENEMIHMSIRLKLAYAHTISTSTSTNLVLDVTYLQNDKVIQKKLYRGAYTDINWWSSESEIKDSFNQALGKILEDVAVDMKKICQAKEY
jgi:hypothetical protein